MAFCKKCGTQIPDDSAYCPACGEITSGVKNSVDSAWHHNRSGHQPSDNDIEENKLISVLCYFGFLFVIPYFARQDSQFVKFHANQGLVLFLFSIIASIAAKIPFLGWIVGLISGLFVLICFVMGIYNVLSGKMRELPIIGHIKLLGK